ncbi:hypothetical protein N8T08_001911 [Aspergillus melleus]|uniref:Uncharacterized protein n=1 Tax=Aspergillus melleus TaxID=138277 RepID=A0ACC3B9U3_9EURO|nr:hypothetical protein N8T08_001911 [Aspergillus melleus]
MLFQANRLIQGNHLTPSSNSSSLVHTNITLRDSKPRLVQPYKHHLALISRASAIAIATRKRLHESCQDANIHAMVLVLTAIIPRDWCRTLGPHGSWTVRSFEKEASAAPVRRDWLKDARNLQITNDEAMSSTTVVARCSQDLGMGPSIRNLANLLGKDQNAFSDAAWHGSTNSGGH